LIPRHKNEQPSEDGANFALFFPRHGKRKVRNGPEFRDVTSRGNWPNQPVLLDAASQPEYMITTTRYSFTREFDSSRSTAALRKFPD